LNWIGKEAVVNHHLQVPFHLLKDVPEPACGDTGSGNLIVQGGFLPRMRFTSLTQVLESRSVRARSWLLGISIAYSTRSQSSEDSVRGGEGGSMPQFGLLGAGPVRKTERPHLLAQDYRVDKLG
jgi:hypothetical protein